MTKKTRQLIAPYHVASGKKFRLTGIDPGSIGPFKDDQKDAASLRLQRGVEALTELQEKLYAQDRWSVLIILQAMDAAGKDSTIKHVMSGVNPQGCQVFSFKAPNSEELDHDYLWRCLKSLPERGRIGIFNRSYYEEVLVVRVHQNLLQNQRLPASLVGEDIWRERFEDINAVERYLSRNGTLVLKFFLHVSAEEQRKRFLQRLDTPSKNWKFSIADANERAHWNDYMDAYEDMIRHTSTEHAPWYVVPADNKWFTRLVVSSVIVERMGELDLQFPKIDIAKRQELGEARRALESSGLPKRRKSN